MCSATALTLGPLDSLVPVREELLPGNNGNMSDACDLPPNTVQVAEAWRQEKLAKAANIWVAKAATPTTSVPSLPGAYTGEPDEAGVRLAQQLNTAPVGNTYWPASQQGVVLLEPFGGLCAGLEMALRSGTAVQQYHYIDSSPAARAIAAHRLLQLQNMYPALLPCTAVQRAFALPQDIRLVTTQHLCSVGAQQQQHQWLVVAGWPCQDLSMAGSGAGIKGARSSLMHELVRLVGALQQLQPRLPPAYILENVAFQYHPDPRIADQDFKAVCRLIGQPTVLDAAQFGSLAHRVRNFWTNLCTESQLTAAAAQVVRPGGGTVLLALGPGRLPQSVRTPDMPPRHSVNETGQPMRAWPTLVSHPHSYAFRPGEPGSVVTPEGLYDQPSAVEREFALGYTRESTAAPGVSEQHRRHALGQCMDSNCLQVLYNIAQAWASRNATPMATHTAVASTATTNGPRRTYSCVRTCMAAAAAQDAQHSTHATSDIWNDANAMHCLQEGAPPEQVTAAERSRIRKRQQYYSWDAPHLRRHMPDGSLKLVPPPAERLELVKRFHDRCGHWGVRRTAALVQTKYWWHGVQADTAAVVMACKECSRVKATFGLAQPPELQSLEIGGMFYRWGVDLCGPFPQTSKGNVYIMVMVEHFTKQIEAVPIPSKEPKHTAYAFAHSVLARYGACAEVVHDNGSEWKDEFATLLRDALIDARPTSANHPQANGAAESLYMWSRVPCAKCVCRNAAQLTGISTSHGCCWGIAAVPNRALG